MRDELAGASVTVNAGANCSPPRYLSKRCAACQSPFRRMTRAFHEDFVFRYPEKAGDVNLFSAVSSIDATNELLSEVFRGFDPHEIQDIIR